MEKIIKTLNFEIKDINEEERSFTAVASTDTVDRDGDRIFAAGWNLENFLKNPVIPWAHQYGDPPVAGAMNVWVDNGRLMFTLKFPAEGDYPFADTIWKLYKAKILRAFSVGFRPGRRELVERGKGVRGWDFIEGHELWEISACTVPSNPDALVAAKSAGLVTDEEADLITGKKCAGLCLECSCESKKEKEAAGTLDPGPMFLEFGTLSADGSRKNIILAGGKDFDPAVFLQTIIDFNKNVQAMTESAPPLETLQSSLKTMDALTARLEGLEAALASIQPKPDTPAAIRAAIPQDLGPGTLDPGPPETLSPEMVGKAIAAALQGIEKRIESTVDKRLRYHLGKVD